MTEVKENVTRINPLCVISKEANENGWHDIQTNSAWSANPYDEAFAVVPDYMVEAIMETYGYCDIELNEDGTEVVSFIKREIPIVEVEETMTEEDITLDLLADHEYRLCMIELGMV